MTLKTLDLFSGIGGFALASRMVGRFETAQFVEIDRYCQRVLSKNFPGVPIHDDIRTFAAKLGDYDCITAGFPCQDISAANSNGRGLEGERSGLFFEVIRLIRAVRPRYVVLENVANLLRINNGRDMGTVLWELSQVGYDAEWQVISAASVGAPHLRERVFIIAYRDIQRRHDRINYWESGSIHDNFYRTPPKASTQRRELFSIAGTMGEIDADTNGQRCEECDPSSSRCQPRHVARPSAESRHHWAVEPGVLRVVDGVSDRVDRIRGLGNAVVPQVAAIALQRVLELEHEMQSDIHRSTKPNHVFPASPRLPSPPNLEATAATREAMQNPCPRVMV